MRSSSNKSSSSLSDKDHKLARDECVYDLRDLKGLGGVRLRDLEKVRLRGLEGVKSEQRKVFYI